MKKLMVAIDGNVVFDGEVAEFQWVENDEGVNVTGKFTKTMNQVAEALQNAMAQRHQLLQSATPEGPPSQDNVLRLPDPPNPMDVV